MTIDDLVDELVSKQEENIDDYEIRIEDHSGTEGPTHIRRVRWEHQDKRVILEVE